MDSVNKPLDQDARAAAACTVTDWLLRRDQGWIEMHRPRHEGDLLIEKTPGDTLVDPRRILTSPISHRARHQPPRVVRSIRLRGTNFSSGYGTRSFVRGGRWFYHVSLQIAIQLTRRVERITLPPSRQIASHLFRLCV